MAAVTSCTQTQVLPNIGEQIVHITTPADADSADTIDMTDSTNGGFKRVLAVITALDTTTGDTVTATHDTTTITIDAAGGTTDHVYEIFAIVI